MNPINDQQLDKIEACVTGPLGEATVFDHTTVEQLVAEVRRLRAQGAAIEGLERAFTAELDDTNALALVDALIVLRSKLPCTCARSRGLHEKACQRYVPGHDLLSGHSRLAQARAEMRPAVRPAVETGA